MAPFGLPARHRQAFEPMVRPDPIGAYGFVDLSACRSDHRDNGRLVVRDVSIGVIEFGRSRRQPV